MSTDKKDGCCHETGRKFTITATVTEKDRDPLYLGDELDEMAEEIDAAEDEPTPMMREAKKLHDELRHQSCTHPATERRIDQWGKQTCLACGGFVKQSCPTCGHTLLVACNKQETP